MKLKVADKKRINIREIAANQTTFLCGVNITVLLEIKNDSHTKEMDVTTHVNSYYHFNVGRLHPVIIVYYSWYCKYLNCNKNIKLKE
jgi:hypothetical protein